MNVYIMVLWMRNLKIQYYKHKAYSKVTNIYCIYVKHIFILKYWTCISQVEGRVNGKIISKIRCQNLRSFFFQTIVWREKILLNHFDKSVSAFSKEHPIPKFCTWPYNHALGPPSAFKNLFNFFFQNINFCLFTIPYVVKKQLFN